MSTELEALRGRHNDDLVTLEQVQQRESELVEALEKAKTDHALAIEDLRLEHQDVLHAKVPVGLVANLGLGRLKISSSPKSERRCLVAQ